MTQTQLFKKGYIPWNKDTKGLSKANSGSFKKGHLGKKKILSSEQGRFIKENYKDLTFKEIGNFLGLSKPTLRKIMNELNIPKNIKTRIFTLEEKDFIKNNYMNMSYRDIAKILNITRDSVKDKILNQMGLIKRTTIPHYYTDKENEFIRNNYLTMKNKELAKCLNVDVDSIHNQLTKIGIARDFYWEKEMAPNWRGGIAFEPYDFNFHPNFKLLIKQREGFLCIKCGMRDEDALILFKKGLHIHHIDYNKQLTVKENCCCLCNRCHGEVNFNREHWIKFFQSLLTERYGYLYNEGSIILNINGGRQNG